MIKENHKKKELLRIASYNILNGGEKRLKYLSRAIKKMNPDICGILEAVGWEKERIDLQKIARDLEFSFFKVVKANSKYNIAIFSKIPLDVKNIKKEIKHVTLEAKIKTGSFKNLGIFFVHLSPVSEDERLKELKELTRHIKKYSKVIVMGDFNSLSSHDPYNHKKLLEAFKKNKVTKYGIERLDFDVIKKIQHLGFIDAVDYLKLPFIATTPTASNEDLNHATKIRIDYAFLSKNILTNLKKVKIIKNKLTDKASDHYPIYIDLQTERGVVT